MYAHLQDTYPWTLGKRITVECDPGYVVSPPTPPEADGFRAECVPGGDPPAWKYTSLDGTIEYASTPKCSNMKFCQVGNQIQSELWSRFC